MAEASGHAQGDRRTGRGPRHHAVSKTVMPMRVPTGKSSVIAGVFATDSMRIRPCCRRASIRRGQSSTAPGCGTTHATTPSDVFVTFPRPSQPIGSPRSAGHSTPSGERSCCAATRADKLYNLVNDPDYADDDIDADAGDPRRTRPGRHGRLRWDDVELDHGFHTYRQMQRWTVTPAARVEILDRLLEENLRRAATQGEAPPPAEDEDEGDDE